MPSAKFVRQQQKERFICTHVLPKLLTNKSKHAALPILSTRHRWVAPYRSQYYPLPSAFLLALQDRKISAWLPSELTAVFINIEYLHSSLAIEVVGVLHLLQDHQRRNPFIQAHRDRPFLLLPRYWSLIARPHCHHPEM
jgi:hypothetical protein